MQRQFEREERERQERMEEKERQERLEEKPHGRHQNLSEDS